jgi:hypothetical protein
MDRFEISINYEEALGLVIDIDTTLAIWEALKDADAQDSQE